MSESLADSNHFCVVPAAVLWVATDIDGLTGMAAELRNFHATGAHDMVVVHEGDELVD